MATTEKKVVLVDVTTSVEQIERERALGIGENVKVEFRPEFDITMIVADDSENIRFNKGETVGGVKLGKDLRNIPGMVSQIEEVGRVTNPVVVSEREDGTFHLLQGFRRVNAVRWIRRHKKGTELAERLSAIPVIVYTGLTAEQERGLVNDQTSKAFSKAEVLQRMFDEFDGGYHWFTAGERNYQLIARVTGAEDVVRKIDNIEDKKEKAKELRLWLQSILYQGWYDAWMSGPTIRNLWLKTYLWQDGYVDKGERPRVLMTVDRMKQLHKAVKKDRVANEWNEREGSGPRTEKLLAEFEVKDKIRFKEIDKPGGDGVTTKPKYRRIDETVELLNRYKDGGEPTLTSRLLAICLKDGGDPEAVTLVSNYDRLIRTYEQHRDYITDELRATLDLVFRPNGDTSELFGGYLMDNASVSDEAGHVTEEEEEALAGVEE